MKRTVRTFIWLAAVLLLVTGGSVPASAATDCAFQDVNDNGVFDAGIDVNLLDSAWIGATFSSIHPFVVPSGCGITRGTPPGLTRVIATKITILANLEILVKTGGPIVLEANPDAIAGAQKGDGSIKVAGTSTAITTIQAGGATGSLFPDNVLGNEAIHNRAITIVARGRTSPAAPGTCTFTSAELDTIVPGGTNDIGVHCNGDITFRNTKFKAARINIQSLGGTIDARSLGGTAGKALGNLCDDPTFNVTGQGNGNGVIDPGDFPCTLDLGANYPGVTTFHDADELDAFCDINDPHGFNRFLALNDPLTMIAQTVLDLRGSGAPGFDTIVSGRYRVVLASVTGDVLLQNTEVKNGDGILAGGAKIELSATPGSVNRLQNDHEDFFGPLASGTIDITSACLRSGRRILYSAGDTVNGTPDPPACAQFPADFTPMPNLVN